MLQSSSTASQDLSTAIQPVVNQALLTTEETPTASRSSTPLRVDPYAPPVALPNNKQIAFLGNGMYVWADGQPDIPAWYSRFPTFEKIIDAQTGDEDWLSFRAVTWEVYVKDGIPSIEHFIQVNKIENRYKTGAMVRGYSGDEPEIVNEGFEALGIFNRSQLFSTIDIPWARLISEIKPPDVPPPHPAPVQIYPDIPPFDESSTSFQVETSWSAPSNTFDQAKLPLVLTTDFNPEIQFADLTVSNVSEQPESTVPISPAMFAQAISLVENVAAPFLIKEGLLQSNPPIVEPVQVDLTSIAPPVATSVFELGDAEFWERLRKPLVEPIEMLPAEFKFEFASL